APGSRRSGIYRSVGRHGVRRRVGRARAWGARRSRFHGSRRPSSLRIPPTPRAARARARTGSRVMPLGLAGQKAAVPDAERLRLVPVDAGAYAGAGAVDTGEGARRQVIPRPLRVAGLRHLSAALGGSVLAHAGLALVRAS